MRSPRLPAACAVLVLTAGTAALGAAPALADDASPTATPSATATAPAAPTAGATPADTPSAAPTAPGSPWPADCPEGPMASPMPVTGSSGTAGELTVTFDNVSTAAIHELTTTLALADGGSALAVELRAPGGDWKPLTLSGAPVDAGHYQLAQGHKLTLRLRTTAPGGHRLTVTAKSELLPSGSAPAKKYTCPQLTGSYTGTLTGATRTPAPASTPTHPGPSRLADTGAGTASRPLALAGTATLLLGTALLLATRRRSTHD
ncbi:LPXTG cell wall anchor domain-containing protein [Kitasatospora sp. NPDC094028]